MDIPKKIERLEEYKRNVIAWEDSWRDKELQSVLRTYINQNKLWVRQQVIEAHCFQTITIGPPPAIGGLIMERVDPFNLIFDSPYGMSMVSIVGDMIDATIGVLQSAPIEKISKDLRVQLDIHTIKNYAFVAMAIDKKDSSLEDVLDAIKEGASRCGVQAERIDESESNERITDRILESITKAEYVIVDLTYSKPNVYYEAGYAQGIGKIPIYLAKEGTTLEFNLKDYPVIFYRNTKNLKDALEKRIRDLGDKNKK